MSKCIFRIQEKKRKTHTKHNKILAKCPCLFSSKKKGKALFLVELFQLVNGPNSKQKKDSNTRCALQDFLKTPT